MKYYALITVLGAGVVLGGQASQAAPRKVPCPSVIASKETLSYSAKGNFECFPTSRNARKAGYKASRKVPVDPTGWWRLGVVLKKSTCSIVGDPDSYTTTVFLQVKAQDTAVFGSTCPTSERLTGVAENDNFSLSSERVLENDPFCTVGNSLLKTSYTISRLAGDGTTAPRVTLHTIKSCLDPNAGAISCISRWEGQGWKEKENHTFWPQVPANLTEFGGSCSQALSKCADCHTQLPF